jgi:hypothetical protein
MHSGDNGEDRGGYYFPVYGYMESEWVVEAAGTSETSALFC